MSAAFMVTRTSTNTEFQVRWRCSDVQLIVSLSPCLFLSLSHWHHLWQVESSCDRVTSDRECCIHTRFTLTNNS